MDEITKELIDLLKEQIQSIEDFDSKVEILNEVRKSLHSVSPFKTEPVDCVLWIKNETIHANSYNPNAVAGPEMELLKTSILADGFTQPIVSMLESENSREVVDGYHRNRISKEDKEINARLHNYSPLVTINENVTGLSDRMASTIRHNRARGTHSIELMSNIVSELVAAGMSDAWILRHIGMDKDELLRLKQITGLASLFADVDFSKSWELGETLDEDDVMEDAIEDD